MRGWFVAICFRSVLFLACVSGQKKRAGTRPTLLLKEATQNFRDAFYNMVIRKAQDDGGRRGGT
jgi:hypothetical protein